VSLFHLLQKTAEERQAQATAVEQGGGGGVPTMKAWFTPQPHQANAVKRLFENDGRMIFAHGVGTGKSLGSAYAVESLRAAGKATNTVVIAPAGLRKNYLDGAILKGTTVRGKIANRPEEVDPSYEYNVVSYETFRQDPVGIMQRANADTMVVDEYHRARNDDNSTYESLMAGRQLAKNFVGLTGSLINNRPEEIASLVSISENNPSLTGSDFKGKFERTIGETETFTGTKRKLIGVANPAALAKALYPRIDVVDTNDVAGNSMPRKDVKEVKVPMSDEQYKLYQLALKRLGPLSEYVTRKDPNVSMREAHQIFTQIGQARQVSNSVGTARSDVSLEDSAQRTPKVSRVIQDTIKHLNEKPDNQVVLYSNLVRGGVDVLDAGLTQAGIPHALFIGKGTEVGNNTVTETVRQQGVQDYKDKKLKAIIISGAGAEGLDLKDSTAFYSLDGHFNPERILQAEARARRLGGQAERPPEQRVVDVRRYQSVAPTSEQPGFLSRAVGIQPERTVDSWVYDVAKNKAQANKQFMTVLREPYKYLRKETAVDGKVRYIYPHEATQQGLWGRMTGVQTPQIEVPTTAAQLNQPKPPGS
jgi:hypothetical protein